MRLLTRRAGSGHFVTGLTMVALGSLGLVTFWDALGFIARGLMPFGMIGCGLVMMGAGVRSLRENRGISPSLETLTPLFATVACLLIAGAAAADIHVDLPHAWTPSLVAGYMALGLVSGIVGGMLGLGGGLVHLSGMTLIFGCPFAFARGATLINNVFINGAAAMRYGRRGFIQLEAVAVLLPAALVGVTGGSFFQGGLDETTMRRIFATFVLLVTVAVALDTARSLKSSGGGALVKLGKARLASTGGVAGFLSGILGVSGGIIAVPGQTLLSGVNLRNAISNSTLVTAVSSALGSLLLLVTDGAADVGSTEMLTIAALFVPGNLIGGHFGALWMERLPVGAVRACFITALLAIAVRCWGLIQ